MKRPEYSSHRHVLAALLLITGCIAGCSGSDESATPQPGRDMSSGVPDSDVEDASMDQALVERDLSDQPELSDSPDQRMPQEMDSPGDMSDPPDAPDMEPDTGDDPDQAEPSACGICRLGEYCDDVTLGGSNTCFPNRCEGEVRCESDHPERVVTCSLDEELSIPTAVELCEAGKVCGNARCMSTCETAMNTRRRCSPEDSNVSQVCTPSSDTLMFVWDDVETCGESEVCVPSTGRCAAHECSEEDLQRGFVCTETHRARSCEEVEGRRVLSASRTCQEQTQICDLTAPSFDEACACLPERHTCVLGEAQCGTGGSSHRYRVCTTNVLGCRTWSPLNNCSDAPNGVLGCASTSMAGIYRPLSCNMSAQCVTSGMLCSPSQYAP